MNHDPGFHLSCDENLSKGWGPPLRLAIAQEQQALDHLQAQTWGVWLHKAEDGTRHVVLARGDVQRGRLALDRARAAAVPLSSE